jgi:prepilin-type processing-associated H-X9-DG protein
LITKLRSVFYVVADSCAKESAVKMGFIMLIHVRRMGITLLEVIVCVSIVALLLALLLPAVFKARSASQLVVCKNNLRQIGTAIHLYHLDHGSFPAGVIKGRKGPFGHGFSWLGQILPYVEQEAVQQGAADAFRVAKDFSKDPPHTGLSKVITLFTCPSDSRTSISQLSPRGVLVGLTSYLGVAGTNYKMRDGILYGGSSIRVEDVGDGLSNTALVGERPPSYDYRWGWWYAGVGQDGLGSGDLVLGSREAVRGKQMRRICGDSSRFMAGQIGDPCSAYHFWSLHYDGADFLFADGSVRFLTYTGGESLAAYSTRNGGEVVQ